MSKILFLVVALCVAAASRADDRGATVLASEANANGQMEVIAQTTDFSVFQIKQTADRHGWFEWEQTLAPTTGKIVLQRSPFGPLFTFGIENGQLATRQQPGANEGFGPVQKFGSNLDSLAAAVNADKFFNVLAITQGGSLWGIQQVEGGAWGAPVLLGGENLLGAGAVGGRVGAFVVHPNALAAALGHAGVFNAFAVAGDGTMSVITSPDTHHLPTVWGSLGGSNFVDVMAVAAGNRASVLAQDAQGFVSSKTQTADGSWTTNWVQTFPAPSTANAVVADGFGSGILVLHVSSANFSILSLTPNGTWQPSSPSSSIVVPPNAFGPIRQVSAAVGSDHTLMLTAVDTQGVIWQISTVIQSENVDFSKSSWSRIGRVTIAANPPDVAIAALACEITQPQVDALTQEIGAELQDISGLTPLSNLVLPVLTCQNDSQTLGIWLGQEASPSTFPPGILASSGQTHDPEFFAIRATRSGFDRIFADSYATVQKRNHAFLGTDIVLHSANLSFGKSDIAININADWYLGKIPFKLDITAKATMSVDKDGRLDCKTKITGDSKAIEAGSWIWAPMFGKFGLAKVVSDESKSYQNDVGVLCNLVNAFPTDELLPLVAGQPVRKQVFTYNIIKTDDKLGLTAYAAQPPLPALANPRVQWFAVKGVASKDKNQISFDFVAVSADMGSPSFFWSASWPGAVITQLDGPRVIEISFPAPPSMKAGQALGTLTLSASDDHNQMATQTQAVTITKEMLSGKAPKDGSDVAEPRLAR